MKATVYTTQQTGFHNIKLAYVEYVRGLCRHHEFEARRAGMLFLYDVQEKDLQNTPPKLTWNPKMQVWKMVFFFKQVIFRFHINPQCNTNIEDGSSRHSQHSGMYTSLQHPCHPGVPPCPPALTTCTFSLSNTKVVDTKKSALNLLWLVSVSMFKSQTKK